MVLHPENMGAIDLPWVELFGFGLMGFERLNPSYGGIGFGVSAHPAPLWHLP